MKPDKKKTVRKKTNESLLNSESLFLNQFKLSHIGMAITSVKTEWLHINPRLCEMLGYTEEELRLKTWTEMTHPEDLKENLLQFNKMLNDEIEAYELDNRFFRKDGSIIITHLTVSCFRNPDRSVSYIITSFQDITEKKRDEENMRRRNEELSALNRLARTVAGQSSLKEVCDTATREVASVMKTDMSVIFVREGKELHLKSAGPVRMWKEINSVDVHIVGECLCGLAAENGQAIYCQNIHEDKRCTWVECRNAGFRSFTALPLCSGDDTIGVLGIASILEYNFEEKSTFLETVASQLAVSIYNARLLEESRNYAARLEEEITVRKQAVEELMQSRHQLYDIAANSPGIIFQFFYRSDGSMGLYYVSDRGAEITGLENNPRGFLEHFTAGVLEEDRRNFLDSIKKAIETVSNWRFEGRFRKPSGELMWFNAQSTPQLRGDELLFNGIFMDITEQKKTEEDLKLNEARLETLNELNNMRDLSLEAMAQFTMEAAVRLTGSSLGYIAFANEDETVLTMHAWSEEAMKECMIKEIPLVYPVEKTGLWGEAVRQRKPIITNDYSALNPLKKGYPEGHVHIVRHMNVPLFDEERIVIVAGVGNKNENYDQSDVRQLTLLMSGMWRILKRKQAEEELKNLEEQLLQAQKMEAIGQLAGGVAHDFNNLLLAIQGYTGIVMKDMSPYDPRRADLEEVCRAAERATSLTKQLLAFSRRQVLQLTLLNLNKVVEELMKMVQRIIGENFELKVIPAQNLYTVNADRSQLEQVLINLCVNARDAMPDGGSLLIETENITFDSHYCSLNDWARPGRYAKLSITDSGYGMDEDTAKQIFEPFFTTKEDGKGTGLGLSTVYGIVRQHRGMIHVYSEPGKGSRFSIYLPAEEGTEVSVVREPEKPVRGGNETILLAEDEAQIRLLARRILEEAGYHVLTASSGEEAINLYRKYGGEINLLFLDIIMPGKGGQIVYDEIRAINPRIKCLFTSGYSNTAVHTNFILNKSFSLLQKPYKREQLLVAVRQALDKEEKNCPAEEILFGAGIKSHKNTGKILIVDDEENIRDICLFHIEDMGFQGLSASGGEEALKIFRKHTEEILCVVIDLQMPHMKGTETFKEIKSIRPDIPVILSSGYGLEENIDSLIAGGLVDFLYKPYNPQEFKDKITGAIAGFRGIP